jgi:hypothetical protein
MADISIPMSASRRESAALWTEGLEAGTLVRWLAAACSLGAAGIHFAYAPGHFAESSLHGATFIVMAWLQAGFAIALLVRPKRWVIEAGLAINAAIFLLWLLAHTTGVPVEPSPWTPESIGFADALAAGFALAVVISCRALMRPTWTHKKVVANLAVPAVVVSLVGVTALASASMAPALAGGHNHAAVGHSHGGGSAAGHAHGAGGAAAAGGGGAGAAAAAGAHSAGIESGTGLSPCETSGPPVSEGQSGGHGHRGPSTTVAIDDAATRDQLGAELTIARQAALSFPTAGDAKAAGYIRITPYLPCIGAHWIKPPLMDANFDPAFPEMLLYDGSGLDAKVVGLSYWARTGKDNPPTGFTGPNDVWHQHLGLCVGAGGVVGNEATTPEECARRGGQKTDGSDAWMVHVWVVPGWESAWGLFSGEHPELGATPEN